MNLTSLFNRVTYRNEYTYPCPADGLVITTSGTRRSVHHPDIPAYLNTRRARILRDGLDPIDLALMDPDTAQLLRDTAVRHHNQTITAGYVHAGPPR